MSLPVPGPFPAHGRRRLSLTAAAVVAFAISFVSSLPLPQHRHALPIPQRNPSTAPGGTRVNLASELLTAHNKVRAHLGLRPLGWNQTLASYAREWTAKRASDCQPLHSPRQVQYGENIFWGLRDHWTPTDAVRSWVEEYKWYDLVTNGCAAGKMCGHYTQVVWRDTLQLGCDGISCSNGKGKLFFCYYDPPGNVVTQRPFLPLSATAAASVKLEGLLSLLPRGVGA